MRHFNITIAKQGAFPNEFNYDNNDRQIIEDDHIAVWTEGGQNCVSWFATWYDDKGKPPRRVPQVKERKTANSL